MNSIRNHHQGPCNKTARIIPLCQNAYTPSKFYQRTKIALPDSNSLRLVELSEIQYCQADNNYTSVHLIDGTKLVVSKNLGYIYDLLVGSGIFVRVHQSYFVRTESIKAFSHDKVTLSCGTNIPLARNRRNEVKQQILTQVTCLS